MTVLFSSPFSASFAQQEDMILQSCIPSLESGIMFCHVGRMERHILSASGSTNLDWLQTCQTKSLYTLQILFSTAPINR
jgi:hypothetical protein